MRRKCLTTAIAGLLLAGCAGISFLEIGGKGGEMDVSTVIAGLKDALRVGSENAVRETSRVDGYWGNPRIRIPLPSELEKMASILQGIGLGQMVVEFERKMNEAAEEAAALAAPIFLDAIAQMTFDDARQILKGKGTEATDYFRARTEEPLTMAYLPIVSKTMKEVGGVRIYNQLIERYRKIPFVPKPQFEPDRYVTAKGLEGLFSVLGEEEAKIRENPAARVTEILRKVFGSR